jgi:Ca-activated chloride channel family protein
MEELLSGRRQAHLTNPASSAFVGLANAESQDKSGIHLIGATHSLVLSPVVVAMWKPMAEALGWGTKPVGWDEILALANNPKGWSAHGLPQCNGDDSSSDIPTRSSATAASFHCWSRSTQPLEKLAA